MRVCPRYPKGEMKNEGLSPISMSPISNIHFLFFRVRSEGLSPIIIRSVHHLKK